MFKKYDFTNINSVREFDEELNKLSFKCGFGISGISLEDAFNNYIKSETQIYFMALDLKLVLFNMLFVARELNVSRHRRDILEMFLFHNKYVQFVILYRAFYDKYMNFIIRAIYPDQFGKFDKAKSKNRSFYKILKKAPVAFAPTGFFIQFPDEYIDWTYSFINHINDAYRTPEIHGSGSARTWSFSEEDLLQTPYNNILELMTHMKDFFHILASVISGPKYIERWRESMELKKKMFE